jgi:hypothetical protein
MGIPTLHCPDCGAFVPCYSRIPADDGDPSAAEIEKTCDDCGTRFTVAEGM